MTSRNTMLAVLFRTISRREAFASIEKFNPYHDEIGRFTTPGNAVTIGAMPSSMKGSAGHLVALTRTDGGLTFNPKRKNFARKGFAVAVTDKAEEKYPIEPSEGEDWTEEGVQIVKRYMKRHADLLAQPNAHLGTWVDGGTVYLDVSVVVQDASLAAAISAQTNQIAFFDLGTFSEWRDDGTGTYQVSKSASQSPVVYTKATDLKTDDQIRALVEFLLSRTISKHSGGNAHGGTDDQSSHGNWARGSKTSIPTGGSYFDEFGREWKVVVGELDIETASEVMMRYRRPVNPDRFVDGELTVTSGDWALVAIHPHSFRPFINLQYSQVPEGEDPVEYFSAFRDEALAGGRNDYAIVQPVPGPMDQYVQPGQLFDVAGKMVQVDVAGEGVTGTEFLQSLQGAEVPETVRARLEGLEPGQVIHANLSDRSPWSYARYPDSAESIGSVLYNDIVISPLDAQQQMFPDYAPTTDLPGLGPETMQARLYEGSQQRLFATESNFTGASTSDTFYAASVASGQFDTLWGDAMRESAYGAWTTAEVRSLVEAKVIGSAIAEGKSYTDSLTNWDHVAKMMNQMRVDHTNSVINSYVDRLGLPSQQIGVSVALDKAIALEGFNTAEEFAAAIQGEHSERSLSFDPLPDGPLGTLVRQETRRQVNRRDLHEALGGSDEAVRWLDDVEAGGQLNALAEKARRGETIVMSEGRLQSEEAVHRQSYKRKMYPTKAGDLITATDPVLTASDVAEGYSSSRLDRHGKEIFEASILVDGGKQVEAVVDSVRETGGDITVRGVVEIDGKVVGDFRRALHYTDADPYAYMASFTLNKSAQQQGIGSTLVRHWEDQLARAGYGRIEVSATSSKYGMNGGYTWMRQGYDFADPNYSTVELVRGWKYRVQNGDIASAMTLDFPQRNFDRTTEKLINWDPAYRPSSPAALSARIRHDLGADMQESFHQYLKDYGSWRGVKPTKPIDRDRDGIIYEGTDREMYIGQQSLFEKGTRPDWSKMTVVQVANWWMDNEPIEWAKDTRQVRDAFDTAALKGILSKHSGDEAHGGTDDQSSHGNWANGQRTLPGISPTRVPSTVKSLGSTKIQDIVFDAEVPIELLEVQYGDSDPFLVGLGQGSKMYDVERQTPPAQHELYGSPVFGDFYEEWATGDYTGNAKLRRMSASLMGLAVPAGAVAGEDLIGPEATAALIDGDKKAWAMGANRRERALVGTAYKALRDLHYGEAEYPGSLYRGLSNIPPKSSVLTAEVGSTVALPLGSFAPNKSVPSQYLGGSGPGSGGHTTYPDVLIRVEPGAKVVPNFARRETISRREPPMQEAYQWVTGGRFEVVHREFVSAKPGVHRNAYDSLMGLGQWEVTLRQTETFNPVTSSWEPVDGDGDGKVLDGQVGERMAKASLDVIEPWAWALGEMLPPELTKHEGGGHDQKTHGNWASRYGTTTADHDLAGSGGRFLLSPGFQVYGDGKLLLMGHGDLPLYRESYDETDYYVNLDSAQDDFERGFTDYGSGWWTYTGSILQRAASASLLGLEMPKTYTDKIEPVSDEYGAIVTRKLSHVDAEDRGFVDEAVADAYGRAIQAFAAAEQNSPSDAVVRRVLLDVDPSSKVLSLQPGDSYVTPLGSYTQHRGLTREFLMRSSTDNPSVVIELQPGARGAYYNAEGSSSGWMDDPTAESGYSLVSDYGPTEYVIAGRFEVVGRETDPDGTVRVQVVQTHYPKIPRRNRLMGGVPLVPVDGDGDGRVLENEAEGDMGRAVSKSGSLAVPLWWLEGFEGSITKAPDEVKKHSGGEAHGGTDDQSSHGNWANGRAAKPTGIRQFTQGAGELPGKRLKKRGDRDGWIEEDIRISLDTNVRTAFGIDRPEGFRKLPGGGIIQFGQEFDADGNWVRDIVEDSDWVFDDTERTRKIITDALNEISPELRPARVVVGGNPPDGPPIYGASYTWGSDTITLHPLALPVSEYTYSQLPEQFDRWGSWSQQVSETRASLRRLILHEAGHYIDDKIHERTSQWKGPDSWRSVRNRLANDWFQQNFRELDPEGPTTWYLYQNFNRADDWHIHAPAELIAEHFSYEMTGATIPGAKLVNDTLDEFDLSAVLKPRDGDGDGTVFDNTDKERPA